MSNHSNTSVKLIVIIAIFAALGLLIAAQQGLGVATGSSSIGLTGCAEGYEPVFGICQKTQQIIEVNETIQPEEESNQENSTITTEKSQIVIEKNITSAETQKEKNNTQQPEEIIIQNIEIQSGAAPTLTLGNVTPTIGSTADNYTYQVTYTDAENDTADHVIVNVDGTQNFTMNAFDPADLDVTDGKVYEFSKRLSYIPHNFTFIAADLVNVTANTSTQFGPTVSCAVPTNDYRVNKTTTFCPGTYYVNDTGENSGAIEILASNIVISCNGTHIAGNSSSTSNFGVYALARENLTIIGCKVSGYSGAITMDRINNSIVTGVNVTNTSNNGAVRFITGYGDILINSSIETGAGLGVVTGFDSVNISFINNTLTDAPLNLLGDVNDSTIRGNEIIRALIGVGANGINITENSLLNNSGGLGINLGINGNVNHALIGNNNISGALQGIYLNNVQNATIIDNYIDTSAGPLELGVAMNNTIINNTFVKDTTSVLIGNATQNIFINNSFIGGPTIYYTINANSSSINNRIINTTGATTSSSNGGILQVEWFAQVNVTLENGSQANNANVTIYNRTGAQVANATTNAQGLTAIQTLVAYSEVAGTRASQTLLTANATNGTTETPVNFNISNSTTSVSITIQANNRPTVPTLNQPTNSSNFTTDIITLNWSNSTDPDGDAVTYYLEVASDNAFTTIEYANTTINETTNVTGDTTTSLPNGTHYWRVRARDSVGNTSFSPVRQFSTNTSNLPPTVPQLNTPNNTNFNTYSPTLTWSNSTDPNFNSITYYVEVASDNGFTTIEIANSSVAEKANTTSLETSGLNNGTHYWRVLANDGALNSSFSAVRQFNVSVSGGSPAPPIIPGGGGGGCNNQCTRGAVMCSGKGYVECGNYDKDACTEWSPPISCGEGESCSAGKCECQPIIVCGEWTECNNNFQSRVCQDMSVCGTGALSNEQRNCGENIEIPGQVDGAREHNITKCFESQGLSKGEILNLEFLLKQDACDAGREITEIETEFTCGGVEVGLGNEAKINFVLDQLKPSLFISFDQKELEDNYCPWCYDGIQNHDETGIDCGGSCGLCIEKPAQIPVIPPINIPVIPILIVIIALLAIWQVKRNLPHFM